MVTKQALVPDQYVTVNGMRIRYLEAGAGPPLLLLHGLSVHEPADQWRVYFDELGAAHHVYAIDMPGWGLSEMPLSGYDFPLWMNAVAGFVDAMGIETLDIMAYSLGAWIGGLYISEHPGRARRFVSLHNPGLNRVVSQYHPADDVELPSLDRLRRIYASEELARKVYEEMNREGRVEAHTALLHYIGDPAIREQWSLRHRLAEMALPILSADRDTGFVDGTVECAKLAPLARIMITPSLRPMPELVTAGKAFLAEAEITPIGTVR